MFCNHKSSHIIVFITVVNVNYQLALIHIGDSGRKSDVLVFSGSNLGFVTNSMKKVKQYSAMKELFDFHEEPFLVKP